MATILATLRLKEHRKTDHPEKKYQRSFCICDETNGEVMAHCDQIGHALFTDLKILDAKQQVWRLKPNRKVLPSRWLLHNPQGQLTMQFDQKIFAKLIHPLYRVALAVLGPDEQEILRVVDKKSSTGDLLFGTGPNEWAIVSGDTLAAKVLRLPRSQPQKSGFLSKLENFFKGYDWGIQSLTAQHRLSAPEALAMLVIIGELKTLANT